MPPPSHTIASHLYMMPPFLNAKRKTINAEVSVSCSAFTVQRFSFLGYPIAMRSISLLLCVLVTSAAALAGGLTAADLNSKPDPWFTSEEGKKTIDNIISWQRPEGGWEKAYDATTRRPRGAGGGA